LDSDRLRYFHLFSRGRQIYMMQPVVFEANTHVHHLSGEL